MLSLDYIAHCRETYKICPCGAPATEFMHLKHVGMGSNRKKDHWEHLTGLMACNHCHSLYDGRVTKESGVQAYIDAKGQNLVKIAIINLINWLPVHEHLTLLKTVAKWRME